MELRIAKQPPWEQSAPRPAGFGISLIAATNTSIKRLLLRVKVGEGKPEPEIQIQTLQCFPHRSGAYVIAIVYFNKNPTLKAVCTITMRINELTSIFTCLISSIWCGWWSLPNTIWSFVTDLWDVLKHILLLFPFSYSLASWFIHLHPIPRDSNSLIPKLQQIQ